jgi:hypothetical protein
LISSLPFQEDEVMGKANPFQTRNAEAVGQARAPLTHVYGKGRRCNTDTRGFETPSNQSMTELKVDTHLGFVPLWAQGVTLRWRFEDHSVKAFSDPDAAKAEIRKLFGEALVAWGSAAPVRFAEQRDVSDFEIVYTGSDDCDSSGCVLASSFFPDGGRHQFLVYPKMFQQTRKEQVETFEHEVGHIFGLRHWFANISETQWSSAVFGSDGKFTIMNYGANSRLTKADKKDLTKLYTLAWQGQLTEINGTPIRLFKPFSSHL